MKAPSAAVLTIPPLATALFLAGLIGLDTLLTLNTTIPLAAALYTLLHQASVKRTAGGARPEPCIVCTHPERERIEGRLEAGETVSRVSAEYGLGEDVLASHYALHVGRREAGGAGGVDIEAELSRILEELKAMHEELKRLGEFSGPGDVRVQDYVRLMAERRALMRDIRALLLILAGAGTRAGRGHDIGALLERLRKL